MVCTILLLFSIALVGCGQNDSVVARVGEVEITKTDYERFVSRLAPGLQSKKKGKEVALDYLWSIVDQELLLQEARARRIDRNDAVVYKGAELTRNSLAKRYQAEVLLPQIEVVQADIERAFVDRGFDRERLFSRILVRQRTEVARVLAELKEGTPFLELAQRFAANDLFAKEGDGVVGWIGRTQAERFTIPLEIFLSLPVGQVAEPLQLAGGWQIYRFTEDREAELMDYAEEVASMISEEKWQDRMQVEVETLGRSFELQLDQEGLKMLLAQAGSVDEISLAADQAELPLYRFENGQITLGDFLYTLNAIGIREHLQDSSQVADLARLAVLPGYLMQEAARKRGWDRESEFAEWWERKSKALLLQQLRSEIVDAHAGPPEEEVVEYYEANKRRFLTAESVRINQLIVDSREEGIELREAIEEGSTIADLLARPEVDTHGDPANDGVVDLRKVVRARYPQLVDAAFRASEGEWVGPVGLLDRFTVFRVGSKTGGEVQSFSQARIRAEAIVTEKKKNELIDVFIRGLREQRKDQIELFAERLN